MKFVWTVLFACSLLSAASAQDTSKPVDYVARALPLRQVLFDLEKKSGVRLDCDPAMENEPLILKLNGVPLQEALDKIALVFAADWVKHDNVLRLERSPAKVEALRAKIFEKRLSLVKASLNSLVELCNSKPTLDEASAEQLITEAMRNSESNKQNRIPAARLEFHNMSARLPTMRLAVRLLSRMDLAELTQLATTGRVVYSTRPNNMQHAMPAMEPEDIQEWVAGRKAMAQAVAKLAPKPSEDNYSGQSFLSDRGDYAHVPTRVLMSSMDIGMTFPFTVQFTFFNEEGNALANDSENLGESAATGFALRQKMDELRRKALTSGFELGPVGKELAPRIGVPQESLRPLPQFVLDALTHPTTQDPLSMGASDIILKAADLQGANAIALLDDSAPSFALSSARSGKTSLEAYRVLMERFDAHTFDIQPDWIVAMPTDPVQVQEDRIPRNILENLMNSSLEQGFITLEEASDAALNMSPHAFSMAEGMFDPILRAKGANAMYSDYDALRLYAMLGSAQKTKALSPKGLVVNVPELTPDQKASAERLAFLGQKWVEGAPQLVMPSEDVYYEMDPTEALPDGISADCTLEFNVTDEECVFAHTIFAGSPNGYWGPQNLASLGYTLAPALHPELSDPRMPQTDRLTLGTNRTLTVRVKRGKLAVPASASEQHFSADKAMTPQQYLDSLPLAKQLEIKKKVEEFVQRMQAYRKDPPR